MPGVHYKFSAKLDFDTISFHGLHISLHDLKRQIMGREQLKASNCDLQITDAQSKEGEWGGGHGASGTARLVELQTTAWGCSLREPRSALCSSTQRSVSQPGARPASVRGIRRASGTGDTRGGQR